MLRTLCVLGAAACVALPAFAQQTEVIQEKTTTVVVRGTHDIPHDVYDRFHGQGVSDRDMLYAYRIHRMSGASMEDILAMRKDGRSWEQIAERENVPIHRVYGMDDSQVTRPPMHGEVRDHRSRSMVAGSRMDMSMRDDDGTVSYYFGPIPHRDRSYRFERYTLSPMAYHRLRKEGFRREEVYFIANCARMTGLPPDTFAQALYRGMTPREIAYEYSIDPRELARVYPVWRSRAWEREIGERGPEGDRLNVFDTTKL